MCVCAFVVGVYVMSALVSACMCGIVCGTWVDVWVWMCVCVCVSACACVCLSACMVLLISPVVTDQCQAGAIQYKTNHMSPVNLLFLYPAL